MNANQYTLDRFEGDYAIFLKRPEELEQLIIHRSQIGADVVEGDIVLIQDHGENYDITILEKATEKQEKKVERLLEQLKHQKRQ